MAGAPSAALLDDELATLVALAETLIPTDDTPGADAAWALAFFHRHLQRHPDEVTLFRELARHLDELAQATRSAAFAALAVADREAVLRAHYPNLAEAEASSPADRAQRSAMRDVIAGFMTADELDIRDDPYSLHRPRRDRSQVSDPAHSVADARPDVAHDRAIATWSGHGTYARVWRASGYPYAPGEIPEDAKDVGRSPDELIALRARKPR